MKQNIGFVFLCTLLIACGKETAQNIPNQMATPIAGTWKLLTGTIIEKGDTTVTDYTKNVSFIKVINDTHFAFMQHDLTKGKDSAAVFSSGGGRYSLTDSVYTEHLEYCTAREWEGHDFTFTVSMRNDTLIQQGIEKIESEGINRLNIEKYVKVKQ
ncbi:hypothetical protein GXP67_22715 [Rhodocytophaga rosea]|uniref:Lipocalin-like domain-containing protein n=1 Tax=Rhodocytophaga rosea TaxID=2704465 RepID=A0A6C0GMH7_9BACT|nr:hypothetical protein [Rhodocytophaga rosea]QHT69246.1 hypothetical protein GXP67_22715 [Rhodocytophaga rosea]